MADVGSPLADRSERYNVGDYQGCVKELTAQEAEDIATCHRNLSSARRRNGQNIAAAAWWQSVAESIRGDCR